MENYFQYVYSLHKAWNVFIPLFPSLQFFIALFLSRSVLGSAKPTWGECEELSGLAPGWSWVLTRAAPTWNWGWINTAHSAQTMRLGFRGDAYVHYSSCYVITGVAL